MKRNRIKRVLALAVTAGMGIGLLTGCSSAGKDAAANGEAADSAAVQSEAAVSESEKDTQPADAAGGEIPTLIWWTVGGTAPDDYAESMEKINEYLVEKVNCKIDLKVAGWGEYDQKMNTIVNTGEYFDLMFVNSTNYTRFSDMGALADITDIVQTAAPELYSLTPENLWKGAAIDGKVYAVPTYKDSSITQFWCMDDRYVQKYNLDMEQLKTFDDLDAAFRTMKEGEGKAFYPLQMSQGSLFNGFFNNYDNLSMGLQPVGVRVDDETRTVVCALEKEDIIHDLEMLHSWYADGIVNPDANVMTEPPKGLPFLAGQGWPSATASWQITNGVEKYDATKVFGPMYTTDTIRGSMNAVSVNSKYPEKSLEVLQLVNTDPRLRDMLAYGVEGTHFEYVKEGVVRRLTDTWPLAAYTQGTFFIMSITEDADPLQWEQVKQQNEEAAASSVLGFSMDVTPVQNELANCLTVWDKYKYDLLTGASDPEQVLEKCIAELNDAGMQTLISEAQKQIDEFFK